MLAGDIEMYPGPRYQCRRCRKYCKTLDTVVECEDCKKRFHATCSELGNEAFEKKKKKKMNRELKLGIVQPRSLELWIHYVDVHAFHLVNMKLWKIQNTLRKHAYSNI